MDLANERAKYGDDDATLLLKLARGVASYAAATPQVEITEIICTGDTAGSLRGKVFAISNASGRVGVYFQGGPQETTTFNFTGLVAADFVTVGAGKYVLWSNSTERIAYWFNVDGANTQPVVGGVTLYLEVELVVTDEETEIAVAFNGVSGGSGFPISTVVDDAPGLRTDATAGNTAVVVTVTVQGIAPVSAPGGYDDTIPVPFFYDDTNVAIGTALDAAISGEGWSAENAAGTVTVTDDTNGARTNAADVDTGFAITVTQQGA